MPKIMNTNLFIDKSAYLIEQLYTNRLGRVDIELSDLDNPRALKAVTELRLYRLPLYFKIPAQIKLRHCGFVPRLKLDEPVQLERELMVSSPLFIRKRRRKACLECGEIKPVSDDLCTDCKLQIVQAHAPELSDPAMYRLSQKLPWLVPYVGTFRTWKQLKARLNEEAGKQFENPLPYEGWASPKALLLSAIIGCTECGHKHDPIWIWDDPTFDWEDGICASCLPQVDRRDGYWTHVSDHRRHTFRAKYDHCCVCHENHMPYGLWGMCVPCYQSWQDQYLLLENLLKLITRFGALAALLVRTDVAWIQYLSQVLPMRNRHYGKEGDLQPMYLVRTLKDAGININDIILKKR